jgi:hypothetical protein
VAKLAKFLGGIQFSKFNASCESLLQCLLEEKCFKKEFFLTLISSVKNSKKIAFV